MSTGKRVVKWVAGIAGVLLLLWLVWFVTFATVWYSYLGIDFDVSIHRPAGATPIKALRCLPLNGASEKARWLEMVRMKQQQGSEWVAKFNWRTVADPYLGEPIRVHVVGSSTESMLGVSTSYHHETHLLVIADLADGRRVHTIADIPDARTTREMYVLLP